MDMSFPFGEVRGAPACPTTNAAGSRSARTPNTALDQAGGVIPLNTPVVRAERLNDTVEVTWDIAVAGTRPAMDSPQPSLSHDFSTITGVRPFERRRGALAWRA